MCGIVGHVGPQNSVEIVLEGLKRLEYRGYDSAGVCFKDNNGELTLFKKTGKLDNLKAMLKGKNFHSNSCVGHTRWATHGQVSDTNSHPHLNDSVAIVHNGIIENAPELKRALMADGIEFYSDKETDSEVYLGLVVQGIRDGKPFLKAATDAFKKIDGNSAFVVQHRDSKEILAIKRGAPLVCGTNATNAQALVSSDPYALVGVAEKLYFPEDGVLCCLSPNPDSLIKFYELDGTPSSRFMVKEQEMNLEVSEKGEFEHFMIKEIHEQPYLIRSLVQFYFNNGPGTKLLTQMKPEKPRHIHISACGTAFYAGLVIRDYLEKNVGVLCTAELASEFRYREPLIHKGDLAIFISQSGETADTLAAQSVCKKSGVRTLSIVNTEGSTLYRDCDENLLIRAGVEIGVASTKAFTQMVLTGRILAAVLGGKPLDKKLEEKLSLLASRIENLINNEYVIREIAEKIVNYSGYFYTGRGQYYPVALEGALKLKEITYVHAEGYAAGELKHGPIALIDDRMVNIAIVGPELYAKTISNIQEIKARGGVIVTIGPEGDEDLKALSDHYVPLRYEGLHELSPLYANVANQLLAYHMAKFKGTDVDKPRNLAKSVTVE